MASEGFANDVHIGIGVSIEIDEIYEDLCKIKPSGIFLIDICMLRLINNIIEKTINIYEWQQSKNLENEVMMIVKDKLPIKINETFEHRKLKLMYVALNDDVDNKIKLVKEFKNLNFEMLKLESFKF